MDVFVVASDEIKLLVSSFYCRDLWWKTTDFFHSCDFHTEPGTFEFIKPSFIVKESAEFAHLEVRRTNGADGMVEVKWRTRDGTATDGREYRAGEDKLVFNHGETSHTVRIPILGIPVSTLCKYQKGEEEGKRGEEKRGCRGYRRKGGRKEIRKKKEKKGEEK